MDFSLVLKYFACGALGAASLEALKLYEYRGKLHQKAYQQQMKSPAFWAVVVGMLMASGFIAWAMNAERPDAPIWNVVITGIAARSIIRDGIAANVANQSTKLGEQTEGKISARSVFL